MKITIAIPALGRPLITDIAYTALNRTIAELESEGHTCRVFVGGSKRIDGDLAKKHGFEYREFRNEPLGRKFDHLYKWAHQESGDYDWFMEYATDNILRVGYGIEAGKRIKQNDVGFALSCFYIARLTDRKVRLFTNGMSNVGRFTPRVWIERTLERHGELVTHRLSRRLDQSFHKLTARANRPGMGHTAVDSPDDVYLLDIKSELNINGFEDYANRKVVYLDASLYPELTTTDSPWRQPQEKSGATASASTSAPAPAPAATPAQPSETTRAKTTRSSSSPAPRAGASRGASKSSTRRRKTTTARGKSSRAGSSGP